MTFTLVRNDDRLDVRDEDGTLRGYLQGDTLYGITHAGYAEPIGEINHRSEITGKLKKWIEKNTPRTLDI